MRVKVLKVISSWNWDLGDFTDLANSIEWEEVDSKTYSKLVDCVNRHNSHAVKKRQSDYSNIERYVIVVDNQKVAPTLESLMIEFEAHDREAAEKNKKKQVAVAKRKKTLEAKRKEKELAEFERLKRKFEDKDSY